MDSLTQQRNGVMKTFFTYDLVTLANKAGIDLPWRDIKPKFRQEFQREISRLVGVKVKVSEVPSSTDNRKPPFILVQLA